MNFRTILDYIGLGTIFALLLLGVVLIIAWIRLGIVVFNEKYKIGKFGVEKR